MTSHLPFSNREKTMNSMDHHGAKNSIQKLETLAESLQVGTPIPVIIEGSISKCFPLTHLDLVFNLKYHSTYI